MQLQSTIIPDGVTAESLNRHYAGISADLGYEPPKHKLTTTASCPGDDEVLTDIRMFEILDKLQNTATGLDLLLAWFVHLGAPVFCAPLARLFNKSIATSTVLKQWKQATITPVPKTASPQEHTDFRPISVTAVLSRILERVIVREFIYPAILKLPDQLSCTDQYAFRPTGSTTAALVAILYSVTELLSCNPYVVVLALDFSKAFDSVRHFTLLHKMASLNLPAAAYNWLVDFLPARRYASAGNSDRNVSVCPSVCHAPVL